VADWETFDLSDVLPGADELEELQTAVDTLVALGDVAIAVLEVLRAFLVGIPNPLSPILSVLLNELQQVIDNLRETGAFGLYLFPTTLEEIEFYKGGYFKFRQLFLQSLYDVEDPNRPQVGASGTLGAFFILANRASVAEYIRQVISLSRLFRKPELKLAYPAPVSVTIGPADEDGDTPDTSVNIFLEADDLATLYLEWEEPKFTQNIFYDIFGSNKFYIERSKSRDGTLLLRERTRNSLINPVQARREGDGRDIQIQEPALNRYDEPIYLWEPVKPENPFFVLTDSDLSQNFIAGTYSLILRDVKKGIENGYYYRIRSVPNDVELVEQEVDGSTVYALQLNGEEWLESQPSVPVFGYLPDIDTTFDMPTALLNIYRAAYMLRFDITTVDVTGDAYLGSDSLDPNIPDFIVELERDNASQAEFEFVFDVLGLPESLADDPANYPVFGGPLFETLVPDYEDTRQYITTTGLVTASDTLENDPFAGARELFENTFDLSPRERLRLFIDKAAITKIDEILPTFLQNESLYEMIRLLYLSNEADILSALTQDASSIYDNETIRKAVALLIQTVDRYEIQGAPPNWESLRLVQDIIPEADAVLDRLFRIINSLNTSFEGVGTSLDSTIEGLRNRLSTLNDLVDFLDTIIAFYSSLNPIDYTVSVLTIPPGVGGTTYLASEFMNAGDVPETDPQDFSAGVVLAFGGAGPDDATGFFKALEFLFG